MSNNLERLAGNLYEAVNTLHPEEGERLYIIGNDNPIYYQSNNELHRELRYNRLLFRDKDRRDEAQDLIDNINELCETTPTELELLGFKHGQFTYFVKPDLKSIGHGITTDRSIQGIKEGRIHHTLKGAFDFFVKNQPCFAVKSNQRYQRLCITPDGILYICSGYTNRSQDYLDQHRSNSVVFTTVEQLKSLFSLSDNYRWPTESVSPHIKAIFSGEDTLHNTEEWSVSTDDASSDVDTSIAEPPLHGLHKGQRYFYLGRANNVFKGTYQDDIFDRKHLANGLLITSDFTEAWLALAEGLGKNNAEIHLDNNSYYFIYMVDGKLYAATNWTPNNTVHVQSTIFKDTVRFKTKHDMITALWSFDSIILDESLCDDSVRRLLNES